MDNQKKVLKLLDYIRKVVSLRQKLQRNIKDEEWSLFLDELPVDPKRIRLLPQLEGQEGVLLEVEKPEFIPCPELPFDLLGWIRTPNYKDFAVVDIEVREQRQRHDERLGDVTERFVDSGVRLAALEKWKRQRTLWRAGEMVKSRTQELFMELYELYDRLRKEPEGLELVAGNGFFLSGLDAGINHPIILKRVQLRYDKKGKMQLLDAEYPTELYADMFQEMPGVEADGLRAFGEALDEADIHPWSETLASFLEENTAALTPNCRFAANRFDVLPTDWYLAYERQVLFLRRVQPGTERSITAMMARIEKEGDVPEALLRIVDPDAPQEAAEPLALDLSDIRGEAEDILLTKAANAEQLGIARKLAASPAVVVQGPPGTGKTHTIANLLGHFLAQGKHVLVTSATNKALHVLKEKLPAGIQDLCVSLLDGGKADMQRSVQGICERLSHSDAEALAQQVAVLAERRQAVLQQLREKRQLLEDMQRFEAKRDYFVLGGRAWSPSRMAAFIHDHPELDDVVPGTVAEGVLPLSAEDLAALYQTNTLFTPDMLAEMEERLPERGRMLPPETAGPLIAMAAEEKQRREELLASLPEMSVDELGLLCKNGQPVAQDLSVQRLQEASDLYAGIDFAVLEGRWAQEALLAGMRKGAYLEVWQMLGRAIERVQLLKQQNMTQFFGVDFAYRGKGRLTQQLIQTLADMAAAFDAHGRLSWWDKLWHSDWKAVQAAFTIDGKEIASRRDCQLAMQYVTLHLARHDVQVKWQQLLEPYGMITWEELSAQGDDLDDLLSARWQEIEVYLHFQENVWQDLLLLWRQAGVDWQLIYGKPGYATPHGTLKARLRWLREDFPHLQALLLMQARRQASADSLRETKDALDAADGALARQFGHALAAGSGEAYAEAYAKLVNYEKLLPRLQQRQHLLQQVAKAAPQWAAQIESLAGHSGAGTPPENIEDAWLYAQFRRELAQLPQGDAQCIEVEIKELTERFAQATAALAENQAWQHLLANVEGNSLQTSLVGWSKAVQKLGRGKGRYAARHRREAQACMREAQNAVPAWIMPLPRVWQNLDPESPKFDIILIDEASQADITALPLLYFGKQVIIVGDDKQVSPAAVGVTAAEITHLQNSTIEGVIKHASLYTMDTSLYDIAQMNFAARMLTEHFRCVPEIIGYSNQLAYDGRIRPLRESGRLLPPWVTVKVHGIREPGRKQNLLEAEYIVATLSACLQEPAYQGLTFGAISMLGTEQGKLIRELAVQEIGITALEACHFLCGSPADFQGDERDVIFLSLVDSRDSLEALQQMRLVGEGHAGDTAKRYNVAVSRAREQVWIFHSMDIDDLKEGDLRRGLLEYAAAPKAVDEMADKQPASLELTVVRSLQAEGYEIRQNMAVGSLVVPVAAQYGEKRVIIACDGEHWVDSLKEAADLRYSQAVLERMGWNFVRVRGSQWYLDPEASLAQLKAELQALGIVPGQAPDEEQAEGQEIVTYLQQRAAQLVTGWHK
ncbi:AAA domain-containing protein [Selenomonas ruminantium]|uniref:AAA domain-containing protein n=1 Tax=Selenomonas ruminantium TaxID=971 RepID=A0A1M6SUZ8_SELRU|nr:AAA domain-containing protein [Selenomonas ruminantium]SHK48467.1 AAA domain-containing protein [Selenomonas ruminantium]